MNSRIRIGTSGFGVSKVEYFRRFSCVEVQHTFYQPPQVSTLKRWREEAPVEFEFTLKAWQLITHDAKSPTYRRLKRNLAETEKRDAGYSRSTPLVEEAWDTTLACAEALQAKTMLFQCPGSFKPNEENIANLTNFFEHTKRRQLRGELNFCWEPRGDWDHKLLEELCEHLGLWHVVDPFVNKTVTPRRCYFRLHGRGGWRYEYDDVELRELMGLLPIELSKVGGKESGYVFFNNMAMTKDALSFEKLLEAHPRITADAGQ